MAELAHDAADCVVCRAKAEAPRRVLQALALFAAGLCVTTGILNLRPGTHTQAHRTAAAHARAAAPAAEARRGAQAHLTFVHAQATEAARNAASVGLERAAAVGLSRSFFDGTVFTTAARVAQWRPQVVRAARAAGVDPNVLEAMVWVESSGRPDVTNRSAVGLTQLSPWVARSMGLHVDVRHAAVLTHRVARSWRVAHTRQLRHWRARYDERFDPAKELRATAAYLARARTVLGRDDLAIQAYHVGIPRLHGTDASYAELYFNGGRVDDYALRVFAAARIMHLYRANRAALAFEAQQQARKNSAEEYLHPLYRTCRFPSPGALLRAEQHRVLRMIPVHARTTHILVGGALGGEARAFGRSRRLYRALRPAALDVLLYIGRRVHELSGARKPLILTSAVRDLRYQRVLMRVNANAARSYSLHTAGYAFDIARSYGSKRQANAFQYVLDRLTAANVVAYIREAAAIHVAVAADAPEKLKLLETLG
jgi:soluble lytic murein transglycosylase-like protein